MRIKIFGLLAFLLLITSAPAKAQFNTNNDAYGWGYSMGLVARGQSNIVNKNYYQAYELFREAYNDYNSKDAAAWLGIMYELGMYVDADRSKAKQYYEWASSSNGMASGALYRIRTSGYWEATEETRNWFVNNYNAMMQAQFNNMTPNYGSGSSFGNNNSSSSSSRTCPSCGGTGNCKGCGGQGKYWEEVGQFTGHSHEKLVDCPICGGTTRCGTCRGKGSI